MTPRSLTLPAADLTEYVYAVDLDAELLGRLEGRLEKRDVGDVGDVETIEGDARELPSLLPERVDTVLLANTFHGVDNRTGFAASVHGALETDGRFVVVNWQGRPPEKTTALGEPPGSAGWAADDTRRDHRGRRTRRLRSRQNRRTRPVLLRRVFPPEVGIRWFDPKRRA